MPRLDIYVCDECNEIIEKRYNSMKDERLQEINCPKCDGVAKFNYKLTISGSKTVIPPHMKAGYNSLNYDKL